ncbi:MAG: outer membrane protein assembly factor BamA [Bacteroidetes bacterium]|nr:outer membrane protein assembly factor BamA [Bacteroidota bacterium]MBU1114107.1 outer membrane protein assembly factor BamA [Bacteroidota bacterium]MBU1800180.1 outer membrane protein assembly factor BamA [Bacteroidota bacterium]
MGITVEGNTTADPATVIANSGLKVGDEIEIPGDQTLNAIKRLWKLGLFTSDIKIDIEKKVADGAFIVIKVNEFPRIEKYIFNGNDDLDDEDLDKAVTFVSGQILKPQTIYKSIREMKNLYIAEDLMNAQITTSLFEFVKADTTDDDEITVTWQDKNDNSVTEETVYDFDPKSKRNIIHRIKDRLLLVYNIEEGEKVDVTKITFLNNSAFSSDDLKSELAETSEPVWWKFWKSSTFNREDYIKDKELLKSFYNKGGYRDFEIISDSLVYNDNKTELEIYLNIHEGSQIIVRDIIWEGNTVYNDNILDARLDFKKGDVYDLDRFNQNLRFNEKQTDVSSIYQDNGYLGFNLETREERIAEDSVDIVITIRENQRFKIGEVNITGNTKTMGKVIRRELYTIPGDYFSRTAIFSSLQQLANLKYFNVEGLYTKGIDYKPVNDSTVNLTYSVEERSSDYLNASVGYSGSYGFSGSVGITLTNFDIIHPFTMGGGQILNFNWQFGVGNYYRTFSLGFTEPWFMDTPTMVGFDIFDTRQNYYYDLSQTGLTLRVGRRLRWPDKYFYIQGMVKYQYNDIKNGGYYYDEGTYNQYTIGSTISRTDIDNPIFPSRGSKISLNAELSGGPFLPGEVDYFKMQFKTDFYRRLFNSNRLVFYAGIDMGYLEELQSDTHINPLEYFFMGGNGLTVATTPLRGYDDRTIGPNKGQSGGSIMTRYVTELRIALTLDPMPIYFIAFAEAGNVYKDLKSTDFYDLRKSVGIGARILINPIGLIGFDYGYGFDRKLVDGLDPQWVFHFQFGQGF